MGRAHCPKCKIEREIDPLAVSRVGVRVMRCPSCSGLLVWGPLPPPPPPKPDPKRLRELDGALERLRADLARLPPEKGDETRQRVAELEAELQSLRMAQLYHEREEARAYVAQPLPGDDELRRIAARIRPLIEDREREVQRRRELCARLQIDTPRFPSPLETLERFLASGA